MKTKKQKERGKEDLAYRFWKKYDEADFLEYSYSRKN